MRGKAQAGNENLIECMALWGEPLEKLKRNAESK